MENRIIIFNFLSFNFQPSHNFLHFEINIQNITKHKYCNEIHINLFIYSEVIV
jgi:hypothetical protein